jgi:hypothetical protein
MFKDSWGEIIAEENRAKAEKRKKREHRPDPKHKKVIREVMRDKIARQNARRIDLQGSGHPNP